MRILQLTLFDCALLGRLPVRIDRLHVDAHGAFGRVHTADDREAQRFGARSLDEARLAYGESIAATRQCAEFALLLLGPIGIGFGAVVMDAGSSRFDGNVLGGLNVVK